jgi:hypothetical protein
MPMSSDRDTRPRRLQFTIRSALLVTAVVALVLGWYRGQRRNDELLQRLWRAQSEISLQNSRTALYETPKNQAFGEGGLSLACLDGANLRGMSISGGSFQRASFKKSDLRGTTLVGGGSSFQGAQFDNANLAKATLTGEDASFQLASFVGADLTGAVLMGSFQGASFQGAKLIGARVVAHFQAVNIDQAQFQQADLSRIDPRALESCYFDTPPRYDEKTKFPDGFNPARQGWALER